MLGEHTNKVLGELGYSGPEIDRLLESNAAVSTNSLLKRMGQPGTALLLFLFEGVNVQSPFWGSIVHQLRH